MSRPRKVNKIPMSTVALSEELIKKMVVFKPSSKTWYDFINQMFSEWYAWKPEIEEWTELVPFMREQLEQRENRIRDLLEIIEVMKKDKLALESQITQ